MPDSTEPNRSSDRLTGPDAALLSSQIAGLARSGLPMAQGLAALAAELPRGGLRRSIENLATLLEQGMPLDQAVKLRDESVPPHLRGLLAAGMRSGELGSLLDRFYEYLSIGVDLKRRLWLSLAYPALTVGVSLALLFGVCVFLVGQFEAIYQDFGIPLPTMTRVLIAVSRWTRTRDHSARHHRGSHLVRLADQSNFLAAGHAPQHRLRATPARYRVALDVPGRVLPFAGPPGGRSTSALRRNSVDWSRH